MVHYGHVLLRVLTGLLLIGMGLAVVFVAVNPPTTESFYPRCLLYSATGLYCPGCGGTRSVYLLSQGNVVSAISSNLLVILALPFLVVLLGKMVKFVLTGSWKPVLNVHRWVSTLVVASLFFSALRNLPGFDFLQPEPISASAPK